MVKVTKRTLDGDTEVWPVIMAALGAIGEMALERGDVRDALEWASVVEHVSRFAKHATTKHMEEWSQRFTSLLTDAGHPASWIVEEVEE